MRHAYKGSALDWLVLIHNVISKFKPKDGVPDPEGSFSVNMSANAERGVEKAIVEKGLGVTTLYS